MSEPLPRRRRPHRTGLQRLVLVGNSLVVLGSLMTAGVIYWGADTANSVKRVVIPVASEIAAPEAIIPGITPDTLAEAGEIESFPAQNWLVTASDSRECIDPNSPYAGAFLATKNGFGESERTDTIMIFRLDTNNRRAAILSLPRDLWVKVGKSGTRSKINTTYDPKNPNRLINTIRTNLGVGIDHYLSIDFCAFKDLVDTLGGINLFFSFPTRDRNTGLNVDVGCQHLQGDAALAYARSRKLEQKKGKKWTQDPSSDIGRIERQQQLVKRLMEKAIDTGPTDPTTIAAIIGDLTRNVTLDARVNNKQLVSLALQLRSIDPASIPTFQLDTRGEIIDDLAVLQLLKTRRNQRLFDVFQGKATLATAQADVDADAESTSSSSTKPGVGTAPVPDGGIPDVEIDQEEFGFVPVDVAECAP
jgi:LCP family protein required for cell wall assembly